MNARTYSEYLEEMSIDRMDCYSTEAQHDHLIALTNLYCYMDDLLVLLGMRKYRKVLSDTDDQIRASLH